MIATLRMSSQIVSGWICEPDRSRGERTLPAAERQLRYGKPADRSTRPQR